ncbi:MAG: DUF1822 family protein [Cyanobacteria bacterium P01_A01_bin.84]
MTANLFTFTSPKELILEIPVETEHEALLESHSLSHPFTRHQAYINKLSLGAVLPWLQEDFTIEKKPSFDNNVLLSFWEFLNGTGINLADGGRIILVPSETIDRDELRVSQEWIDIPELAGDYYLAVEVLPEDRCVKIWGYSHHAHFAKKGRYDASDRTYSIDSRHIITDISALVVASELCAQETTRSVIQPIAHISLEQAQNLIERLSNPRIIIPRLEIPFQMWAGLIAHGGWRNKLYQTRLGIPEPKSVVDWLQNGISQIAQFGGWESIKLDFSTAGARSIEENTSITAFSRILTIAGQSYELLIAPQLQQEENLWKFELRNATPGGLVPGGIKLRLLTEDLQPFPNNEDTATAASEQIFVIVALEPGEGIVWEIEPLPENYDREILKF